MVSDFGGALGTCGYQGHLGSIELIPDYFVPEVGLFEGGQMGSLIHSFVI